MPRLKYNSLVAPKLLTRIEAAAIAVLSLWAYGQSAASWGLFAALILAPDVVLLGYLKGQRLGAFCYNLGHSYLTPGLIGLCGVVMGADLLQSIALIWIAHIGLDRALGYGLKYPASFLPTHLQRL